VTAEVGRHPSSMSDLSERTSPVGNPRQEPLVHIVVLNWNRCDETRACLEPLRDLDYPRFETVLVDNGSTDGSEGSLRRAFPDLEVIQTGANLGYAGGNNVGIRHAIAAGADYVWVLNNDTRADPLSLFELTAAARRGEHYGIVASQSFREDGWHPSVAYTSSNDRWIPIECDGCDEAQPFHVADRLEGGSLFISVRALIEIGLFDEEYFHYYEDHDLAQRMRQAGWRLGFSCRAKVVHLTGKSLFAGTPQARYYMMRNRLLYQRKVHGERPWRVLLREPRLVRNALSIRQALRRDFRSTLAGVTALTDAFRGRGGPRDFGPSYR
jgi:GT2 family glycosyltransferase